MWHVLTFSNYTWSWTQISEVEWDTQEETQPLDWHSDSLTFVARSHHCYYALTMTNNTTNDALVNWVVLWTLTHPVPLLKALRLLIQLRNGCWVTDLCPTGLHFLSLGRMEESQESTFLDNRAPIQIWIISSRTIIPIVDPKLVFHVCLRVTQSTAG